MCREAVQSPAAICTYHRSLALSHQPPSPMLGARGSVQVSATPPALERGQPPGASDPQVPPGHVFID
ncbi:unnamed protein product [Boreogadus saida]